MASRTLVSQVPALAAIRAMNAVLLTAVQRLDWSPVSRDVRFTVLHQIHQSIIRLRERNGLPPLDDPLPGQPDNVFQRVKQMLLAPRSVATATIQRPDKMKVEAHE
jgi:hypothetical protein